MTDTATIDDLRRELKKAAVTLDAVERYLAKYAEANAALHMAERVLYSPLHTVVETTIYGIEHALQRTDPTTAADQPQTGETAR